jgi:hypothetical protein
MVDFSSIVPIMLLLVILRKPVDIVNGYYREKCGCGPVEPTKEHIPVTYTWVGG